MRPRVWRRLACGGGTLDEQRLDLTALRDIAKRGTGGHGELVEHLSTRELLPHHHAGAVLAGLYESRVNVGGLISEQNIAKLAGQRCFVDDRQVRAASGEGKQEPDRAGAANHRHEDSVRGGGIYRAVASWAGADRRCKRAGHQGVEQAGRVANEANHPSPCPVNTSSRCRLCRPLSMTRAARSPDHMTAVGRVSGRLRSTTPALSTRAMSLSTKPG